MDSILKKGITRHPEKNPRIPAACTFEFQPNAHKNNPAAAETGWLNFAPPALSGRRFTKING
jgi:hypothetical protein